jgi:hypothetical protein
MDLTRIPQEHRARVEREMDEAAQAASTALWTAGGGVRACHEAADKARAAVLARYLEIADEADAAAEKAGGDYMDQELFGNGVMTAAAERARAEVWRRALAKLDGEKADPCTVAALDNAEDIGLTLARRCTTSALLQVARRVMAHPKLDADARVTAEDLEEVERAAQQIREHGRDRGVSAVLLSEKAPRLVAEVRRLTAALDVKTSQHDALSREIDRLETEERRLTEERDEARTALASLQEKARLVLGSDWNVGPGTWGEAVLGQLRAEVEGAPVERTPEVVLRAMLRAYEPVALEAEEASLRSSKDDDEAHRLAWLAGCAIDDVTNLRSSLARLRVKWWEPRLPTRLAADYEARLRGDRPLDAPPGEV